MTMRVSVLLFLAGGCASAAHDGPAPMMNGPGFFDRPFPADSRRVDGHPDVRGFPGEGGSTLVDAYLAAAGEIDGFGTKIGRAHV